MKTCGPLARPASSRSLPTPSTQHPIPACGMIILRV
jgi:hypothetical protein